MKITPGWQFWIDRGGTFTDIVARRPDGSLQIHKLLSHHPQIYKDAATQGIKDILGLASDVPIPLDQIDSIKMGTTVATNALLERKGEPTALVITQGFRDALRIGYQNRPNIFALDIRMPEQVYTAVIEVQERISADGESVQALRPDRVKAELQAVFKQGIRSCAIVFMHGYRYPAHEQQVAAIATEIGFEQISVSHQVSPLIKLISRGDTTAVDAYLSPILRQHINGVTAGLGIKGISSNDHDFGDKPHFLFMQSNGGLIDAAGFQGKNSILSGPAGGIVGAVCTSMKAGFQNIIGFDMGGTSTDVSHFNGQYERVLETEIAGVRLRTPMMDIHTVAAGGGSILSFDGARFRVGPDSAGAFPGPACYGQGGPLTVTDCNVMLGKIRPEYFPAMFGPERNASINAEIVRQKFLALAQKIESVSGQPRLPEQVAAGFLTIAVENMANAIKKISLQRGYDLADYVLTCFGGAGGQHACAVAEVLNIRQVFIHPYAGVLSAYGIGIADVRLDQQQTVRLSLTPETVRTITPTLEALVHKTREKLLTQHPKSDLKIRINQQVHLRYEGTDNTLTIGFASSDQMRQAFESQHQQRYGFVVAERALVIESVSVEVIGQISIADEPLRQKTRVSALEAIDTIALFTGETWEQAQVFRCSDLQPDDQIQGPAIILEATGTTIVETNWLAQVNAYGHLILQRQTASRPYAQALRSQATGSPGVAESMADPIKLEIFNNLFQSIAEQMGVTLQNTSYSVNIKERLDFSCAIFDDSGDLVANAPHIPVHLGSMGDSVQAVIDDWSDRMGPGDSFIVNDPYHGGTHLPDVTVVTPVFIYEGEDQGRNMPAGQRPQFYVASRGHHADIGGITPGSMPAQSTHIAQEGILFEPIRLVHQGQWLESALMDRLVNAPYPARNPQQNLADLQAQVAANICGVSALQQLIKQQNLRLVQQYMAFVQDNAEQSVQSLIRTLTPGDFEYAMDGDRVIKVDIQINHDQNKILVDFTGTSSQQPDNFNAPTSVTKAAVLYVFRSLIKADIPLNAGCLRPVEIIIPDGCLLNPRYPAAVVAGNVEVSQAVTNALFGALGVLSASQGTMNNFTFGNEKFQYYETICGGAGAGKTFKGASAVQTHMTNSRLTDPEIIEDRFPVQLHNFSIRSSSGGSGHYEGGEGVIREFKMLEKMTISILSGHRQVPPFGLHGGGPGRIGQNLLIKADGTSYQLPGTVHLTVEPGDRIRIETPGGGGYGA